MFEKERDAGQTGLPLSAYRLRLTVDGSISSHHRSQQSRESPVEIFTTQRIENSRALVALGDDAGLPKDSKVVRECRRA